MTDDEQKTPPPQTLVTALAEHAGEILAKYGLVPHVWDDAGREALEAAASEIIALARSPSPQPRADV